MQPAHLVAAVQVKTTEGSPRTVSISLSNALRHATSDLPQFIVLVALDGVQPRYFAKHVWGSVIADWLKAGRQADADGVTATHKVQISLTFGSEDERGSGLLEWIRSEINAVAEPYAATKRRFVDLVGFESDRGTARITLALQSGDELLDVQLGLRPEVEAKHFTYTSERFGIRARRPEIDEHNVKLHLMPEGRECTLRIEMPDGAGVPLPATLYSASSGGALAFRVASRALDITVGPRDRVRAKASLGLDDRAGLDEISAFAHLISSKPESDVALQVNVDGSDLDLGAIRMKGNRQTETWSWIALGTGIARAIAADAGRDPGEFRMGDVQDAAGDLQILAALASNRVIRVDFRPEPDAPERFDGFLAYCSAIIGDQVFSAVAHRPLGIDETHNGRRRVMFGPGRTLWSRMSRRDVWSEEPMQSAYQRQLERLCEGAEIMAIGNLAKMVKSGYEDAILSSDLPSGLERDSRKQVGARVCPVRDGSVRR
ncbi:hypothetical protein D3Y57_12000 [Sphingomonas paeninsulae]|uniref:Uncharacterized protein n=2 Tax=Sphingomonas paeninsulae TaxID=2319844 RepID=A0A494TBQ2_SPHPE|nr:hypothetical protein D3Y57_12000 [Sphingomonas paeninsulae]